MLEQSPALQWIIFALGAVTAVYAGILELFIDDHTHRIDCIEHSIAVVRNADERE